MTIKEDPKHDEKAIALVESAHEIELVDSTENPPLVDATPIVGDIEMGGGLAAPQQITAVYTKPTPSTMMGIVLIENTQNPDDVRVEIKAIRETGLVYKTDLDKPSDKRLQVGMEIRRINDTYFDNLKKKPAGSATSHVTDVTNVMKAAESTVTIVARMKSDGTVTMTYTKPTPETTMGIRLKERFDNNGGNYRLEVMTIHDGGLVHKVDSEKLRKDPNCLKPGMEIVSINGVRFDNSHTKTEANSATAATQVMKSSPATVTIMARPGRTTTLSGSRKGDGTYRGGAPPPGAPPGGVWGTDTYHGHNTSLMACLCCVCCTVFSSCIICCNSFDKRPIYKVNNEYYSLSGQKTTATEFIDEVYETSIDEKRRNTAVCTAFFVGLVIIILFRVIAFSQA